jgi:phosphoribosyl 1,2-cyclic phosphodiesterase
VPIPRIRTSGKRYTGVSTLGPPHGLDVHPCPQCRSRDGRDRRQPSSLVIDGRILIDAGPSICGLLDSVKISPRDITTIFLTHRHRDASGGLHAMPPGARVIYPRRSGVTVAGGHRFEAVRVSHDVLTWGYLVDSTVAYFSDYSSLRGVLPALRRARIAILDGSGWKRTFPTHEPMVEVIPMVKALPNLTRVLFTHIGHTGMPHAALERQTRALGDRRFGIAYHGLRLAVRVDGRHEGNRPIRTQEA